MLSFLLLQLLSIFHPCESTDRWLVEVNPDDSKCLEEWWSSQDIDNDMYFKKELPVSNWFVVVLPSKLSTSLRHLVCIQSFLKDAELKNYATIPNDVYFSDQSNMDLIGMKEAWDITTGGINFRGDTIVIATIDDGFQIDHEDLISNRWHNPGEIPDDGIDNDSNGYVDDYFGLNVTSGSDSHPYLSHGTSVSGIIGATGNNEIGISGINWQTKIMFVSYNHHISDLVEAYQYIINLRKKFNQTHGKEGAFVVAVNLSSGLEFALPQNYPLWCAMYDSLGAVGVLGVCSASNRMHNADKNGDLPTRCTSPYTIMVTNINSHDILAENSSFGRISVDIGAPGELSLTTDTSNSYNYFRGTSAAAPHVAGAVALLYSSTCASFFDSLDSNPALVASQIKNAILSSGSINTSLQGITLSGKRLQVDAALRTLQDYCGSLRTKEPLIRFLAPNPTGNGRSRLYVDLKYYNNDLLLEIYSSLGTLIQSRKIYQSEYVKGFIDINTASLPYGVYMVSIRDGSHMETTRLFVK